MNDSFSPLSIFIAESTAYRNVKPEFLHPMENVSIPLGREATLECTVKNLGNYQIAWLRADPDTGTLLSVHTNIIAKDNRLRVTHNNYRQWYLHVKDVREYDRGYYMCQINTEPMTSQTGFLDILVPPSIVEEETSSDVVVDERNKLSLRCKASGYPTPNITWRREDGKELNLGFYGGKRYAGTQTTKVESEYLNISQVVREDMGAYLCIASNGVPPSVSKRISVQVNFRPKIRVPNQLVGATKGTDVQLECNVEASPRPLTSWIRHDQVILLPSHKYQISEEMNSYKIKMKLKITDLEEKDFGAYKCIAKNTPGEKEGYIRVYEVPPPTTLSVPVKSTSSSTAAYNSPKRVLTGE
ncbi:lachesin-like protein [Dinothrombium tinctorium]|uniref:Lachesin-like protein n=1 Tax=Dinothrombium tinctorium TaxID=1965070 RepID=A0A443RK18_9ACAR|nr:lachesin-like protein [Dinothrombium tinctorium]